MRVLMLSDRLSTRGGADQHLLQLVSWASSAGHRVTVGFGVAEQGLAPPPGVAAVKIRGLAAAAASASGRDRLERSLADADLVHLQNVMNPVAIAAATATGRAVVTIQDHRVFCPGPGKTLPEGARCREPMGEGPCATCLPDESYRLRLLGLTRARRDALRGARLVVLSGYMAEELAAVGLPGATVIPPWVEPGPPRDNAGGWFLLGGRLVHHKAPLDALEAWRRAGRPLPLRVAGAGPLAPALADTDRLGWLGPQALLRELRNARALLFPGRWQEPFGILGVEALAQGTPVVVAASGGTGEWSGAGCLEVPPGDVDAIAAAVNRLACEAPYARKLGEDGRRRVAERFGRGRVTALLEKLYGGADEGG